MGRASQKFDRQLFTLKLAELSRQMQIRSAAPDGKAGVASRNTGRSFLMYSLRSCASGWKAWIELPAKSGKRKAR
jgi:hypothetical protein